MWETHLSLSHVDEINAVLYIFSLWFVYVTLQDDVSLDALVATFESRFREGRVNYKWDNLNTLAVSLPDALAEKVGNHFYALQPQCLFVVVLVDVLVLVVLVLFIYLTRVDF